MSDYLSARLIKPQFITVTSAALTWAPIPGGTTVPASVQYLLKNPRVSNVSGAPVTLAVWLVPAGATNNAEHEVIVPSVVIPIASNTFPQFDLTALWGATLAAGDAIWVQAGTGSALIIYSDGLVITG
jgi:hypothetical protein